VANLAAANVLHRRMRTVVSVLAAGLDPVRALNVE